jgi:hypothetical protein
MGYEKGSCFTARPYDSANVEAESNGCVICKTRQNRGTKAEYQEPKPSR